MHCIVHCIVDYILYFCGIMYKTFFFIKLNPLALKDNNNCGSVMLRKWNDQHSCWLLTCKGWMGDLISGVLYGTLCI